MDAITYTTARARLAATMNRVCEDHTPVIITRNGEQAVVMMSLADYEALQETAYLLRSPKNARRLMAATAELARGRGASPKNTASCIASRREHC
jgi:antitoxin YefM